MSPEPDVLPGRHGADLLRARQVAAPVRRFIAGECEPGPAQWQAIGESLMQGDAPMDALLDWMSEAGLAQTMPLYNQVLERGIDAIRDAPEPLRRFFAQVEATPDWLDAELLVEGSRVCCLSGLTGMRVLRDLGLLAGYQASAINRTLVLTGALEKGAQRRIAETSKWWIDCTRPGGMARGAAGYRGTLHVRLVHALVRRRVSRMAEWDASYFGLPVNQGDMHATYLAFSVIFLIGQRLLGVPLSKDERSAVLHLWRYIAWLMGVDERWLHAEENAATRALYHNLLSQAPADASSRQLGAALIDEPLQRHYPNLALLRGRLNRAIHLSIARTFIDAEGRRALGLPDGILPWYPLLTAPPRYLLQRLLRCLPGGRQWLIERGARQQQAYLMTLFGDSHPRLVSLMQVSGTDSSTARPRV
ncbi:oxygenase MpaB family protein [Ectopseudomonas alcaliphila]|uniref:Oxygenase MpaB family protein n=2 Tax=Ectopseudomonas alcaliphila TaxID=101564 RepID=A0ABU4PUG0_9GAMM|nr:oxygenase MpaB family protein [Pseudomonas alcaliphila]MDX5991564.1 oxygenase MpaB family protein [Pseudomonas alcaliphila]